MNMPDAVVAFILGLVAGMVVLSLAARWVHAMWSTFDDARPASVDGSATKRIWSIVGATVLHSGPWALLVAGYVAWQILSGPRQSWWSPFFAGACGAPVVLGVMAAVAMRRRRLPPGPDEPLTEASLAAAKRRFVAWSTVLYGGGMAVLTTLGMAHVSAALIVTVPICLGGGYLFSLVMWQWRKALLQSADIERRKRAKAPLAPRIAD